VRRHSISDFRKLLLILVANYIQNILELSESKMKIASIFTVLMTVVGTTDGNVESSTPAKSHAAPQEESDAQLRYIPKTNSVTRRQVKKGNKRDRFCEVIELVEEVSPSVPDGFSPSQRNLLTFSWNFTNGMGYLVEYDVLIKPSSFIMATKGYILTNGSFYTLSAGNGNGEAAYEAITGGTGQYEQATGTVTTYSPNSECNSYVHLVDICYGPNS